MAGLQKYKSFSIADLLGLDENRDRPRRRTPSVIYHEAGPSGVHVGNSVNRAETGPSGFQLQDVPSTGDDEEYINVVDDGNDIQMVQKGRRLNIACKVCGDNATGRHYGVFTCDGCAGFFKRAIRSKTFFHCRKDGVCVIDKIQRNYCKKCRLDQCYKAGMSAEFAQNDRGPRASTILKQQKDKEKFLNHVALDLAYPKHLLPEYVPEPLSTNYSVPLPHPTPIPILPQPNMPTISAPQYSQNVLPGYSYYVPRYHYP